MRHLKNALTVIGALAVLVLAGNTVSYAATGKALLLGKANTTDRQTTLTRTTPGPALRLTTKAPGNAPFTTNGGGKVAHLNADKLDGLDSSSLRTQSRVYRTSFEGAGHVFLTLPMSSGSYLVSYSVYAEAELDKPISISCWVVEDRVGGVNDVRVASDSTELTIPYVEHTLSASGLVTKTPDVAVRFECDAPDGEFRTGSVPVQIVVTPTARLSTQTVIASVAGASPT